MSNPEEENEYPSEKASKNLKDAMQSIEFAGTMGIYEKILALMVAVTGAATNPFWGVFTKWFEVFGKFFNAEAAQAAAEFGQWVFNEENIQIMKDIAHESGRGYDKLRLVGKELKSINDTIDEWTYWIDALNKAVQPTADLFKDLEKILIRNDRQLSLVIGKISTFNNLLADSGNVWEKLMDYFEDL